MNGNRPLCEFVRLLSLDGIMDSSGQYLFRGVFLAISYVYVGSEEVVEQQDLQSIIQPCF